MKLGHPHHQLVTVFGRRVDFHLLRRTHPQPARLHVHHFLQFLVVGVHVHRRARGLFQFLGAADVIDVGVRNHDGFHREPVPFDDFQDALDVVPGSTTRASRLCSSPKIEQLHCNIPTGRISWIIRRLYTLGMGDMLGVFMQWLHFSSLAMLIGGFCTGAW